MNNCRYCTYLLQADIDIILKTRKDLSETLYTYRICVCDTVRFYIAL